MGSRTHHRQWRSHDPCPGTGYQREGSGCSSFLREPYLCGEHVMTWNRNGLAALTLELICHVVHASWVHSHVSSHHRHLDPVRCRAIVTSSHVMFPPVPWSVRKGRPPILGVASVLDPSLRLPPCPPREHDRGCGIASHIHHICNTSENKVTGRHTRHKAYH